MEVKVTTPDTIAGDVVELHPGDVLELGAGIYRKAVTFAQVRGVPGRPVRIRAQPGAVFDAGLAMPDRLQVGPTDAGFEVIERTRAAVRVLDPATEFPGVYKLSDQGQLRFVGCQHVIVEGLLFRNCSPTAIALLECHHMEFRGIGIEGGAYGFQARGTGTAQLRIEGCTWTQDTTRKLLWESLAWADVHGNWGESAGNGWRCFDGSFFNANEIAGGVEIVGCTIQHAFNGVHLFNRGGRPDLSVGVRVHDCTFSHIKDNPIEAEDAVWNWWIHDNVFHNCHKWLSLELKKVGWVYIFRNCAWADSRPGPKGDANASGAVFKFFKKDDKPEMSEAPIYVFNNSWALRSTIVQEGFVRGLHHVNNAIRFYGPSDGKPAPIYWPWTPFFGRRDVAEPDTPLPPADFTRCWDVFDIRFVGDVINHPHYPRGLRAMGYAVRAGAGADPMFVAPTTGDLSLDRGSPCIAKARKLRLRMRAGADVTLPAGINVGWDQGSKKPFDGLKARAPSVPPLA
ncbi:hypothetical protein FHP25_18090 [Vineibacter terrae]|uniref:Right-handed parallel beta-helix repeat-containing protein n=1 Tax=Vineibacter terrae TaxID=2586908 RepID=A0A5C8PKC0_9HYPH|nr:hypothetical protein [Vineibacter terrae]TXL74115.1 hypothetical protein FHP25_18090 [Vineibacter terrae]